MENSSNNPITILFVHYGDQWLRGSEQCVLSLIERLDPTRFIPVLWCNNESLANEAKKLRIPVYCSPFPILLGWSKPRFNLSGFISEIKMGTQIIRDHNIDIVHCNSAAPTQWINFAARATRTRMLTHLHAQYQARDRVTLGLHHSPTIVGVSHHVVTTFLDEGYPAENLHIISNGIDLQEIDETPPVPLKDSLGLGTDDILLITVGSVTYNKGIDILIKSVRELFDAGIPVHIAIIGDGPDRDAFKQLAENWGVASRVHFLGEQENPASFLKGDADIFVSGTRFEAFGLSIAEASYCGLPVVSPLVGGVVDVVADGLTGLLVEPGSSKALTKAVLHLIQNPEKRKKMGEQGITHIKHHFAVDLYAQQFEALYAQMLNNSKLETAWYRHWHPELSVFTTLCSIIRNGIARPIREIRS